MSESVDTVEVAEQHFKNAGVVKRVEESSMEDGILVVTDMNGYGFGNIIEDFKWDIDVYETFGIEEDEGEYAIGHSIKVRD